MLVFTRRFGPQVLYRAFCSAVTGSMPHNAKDKCEVSSSVVPPSNKPSTAKVDKGRWSQTEPREHNDIPVGVPVDDRPSRKKYEDDDSTCSESEFVVDGYRDSDAGHREPEESDQLLGACWGRGRTFHVCVEGKMSIVNICIPFFSIHISNW